jgi:hypothetical protein
MRSLPLQEVTGAGNQKRSSVIWERQLAAVDERPGHHVIGFAKENKRLDPAWLRYGRGLKSSRFP